jgi:hypothetical protein
MRTLSLLPLLLGIAIYAVDCCPGPQSVPLDTCKGTPTCGECMGVRPDAALACGWCTDSTGVQTCVAADTSAVRPPACTAGWVINATATSCPPIRADGGDPN